MKYNSGGSKTDEQTGDSGSIYPYPGHLYFTHVAAGSRLLCNGTVFAYYEVSSSNDEHDILSYQAMKKHARPYLYSSI